jgi:hypothetical protein
MGFVRNKEDFVCEHCGASVEGDGYTNHCPHCLWSKHVDVDPGDRAAECCGMMRPAKLEGATPDYVIHHECEKCGFTRRNKVQKQDDPDAIVSLAGKS